MRSPDAGTEVIIVGGGPVGLFLGCRLAQLGVPFKVLEARDAHRSESRSIGIHPPALERLAQLGLAETMRARGVEVPAGVAFANGERLGRLAFARCPGPYPFVLTLPQSGTEGLLEARLQELAPGALERGVRVTGLQEDERGVTLLTESGAYRATFIIGCDGKRSRVREAAHIAFPGGSYRDSYLMGDVSDTTDLGCEAGIYLCDGGLVESFPLPGGLRRWVAKTDRYERAPTPADLADLVRTRTGLELPVASTAMLSAFGVQHFLAETFARGRVFLAGDAAHVLSPIGGQGMNLGWLDAWALADVLARAVTERAVIERKDPGVLAAHYSRTRRRAAQRATRRAEFNMLLGRKTSLAPLKYAAVKGLLRSPLEHLFARLFTMRWL